MKLFPIALVFAGCSGHVSFFAGHSTYEEKEPNDSAHSAPYYRGVEAGESFSFTGHITDDSHDPFDGFAVRADEACTIVFELESHELFTDLDVCVFDPDLDEYVVCCDGPSDPEKGSITILEPGKRVHFVVSSARGDTRYTLHVRGQTPHPIVPYDASSAALHAPDAAKAARRDAYHAPIAVEGEHDDREALLPRRAELVVVDLATGALTRTPALRRGSDVVALEGRR